MTHVLKWPRRGRFVDRERSLEVYGGETVAVPDAASDYAGHLEDRGFDRVVNVDPSDADHTVEADGETPELTSGDDDLDGGGTDEETDATADDDRMDYAAFADMGYQDRVEAVEAGRVDHLLDRIEEQDDSKNVREAVAERRDSGGD